jgi:succinoglycan biosynthesis transport protein ExoP
VYQKRYLFVAVMMLVTSGVVALGYILPMKYEATSTVLIERNFLNSIMKGIAVTPSIDDTVQAVSVTMKSRPLVLQVIKDLDLDLSRKTEAEMEMLVKAFQKNMDIKVEMSKSRRDMEMFMVSMTHSNPVIARDFVNALVRRYIEESLSSKRDDTYGANKFLMGQIDLF